MFKSTAPSIIYKSVSRATPKLYIHVLGKKAPQAGFSCLLSTHLRHKARPRKLYKVSQRQKKGSDAKESDVAKIDTPSKNSSH